MDDFPTRLKTEQNCVNRREGFRQTNSTSLKDTIDTNSSCFVFASAGSGKTKTLVDRYVKSLFFGVNLREILCITFTNAAVLEMESRISAVLEALYLNQNGYAENYLKNIIGLKEVGERDIEIAESLFFKFQDDFSNLKILTIHSFCQSLIQQFPLESEIVPGFEIIDESESTDLIKTAKKNALAKLSKDEKLLASLSETMSIYSFEELIDKIYSLSSEFIRFFNSYAGVEEYSALLKNKFHLKEFIKFSEEQQKFIEKFIQNQNLEELYLTKAGTIRKKIPFQDKETSREIAEVTFKNSQNLKKKKFIEKTCLFLNVVKAIIAEYQDIKAKTNVLDFSDVLLKAEYLLTESCAKEFVASKICSQIKAIMIDEAQDLSALQWRLITLFSNEIFSDPHNNKTIFVVGDIKQSIYRFQGADYKLFPRFYERCKDTFSKLGKPLKTIYLNMNYRTLPEILRNIDLTFNGEAAEFAFDQNLIAYKKHMPFRKEPNGQKQGKTFEMIDVSDAEDKAKKIAEFIKSRLTDDSLILTRSRNELTENIANELLELGVRISASDKITLTDNLLIMDILAIADVCIDNTNDYALACILKSPYLFENPLNNNDLFLICNGRITSVFENLKTAYPEKYEFIANIIGCYNENNLLKFFYYLSTIIRKFSEKDSIVLSAFIDEVVKFSRKVSDNIPEFLSYFRAKKTQISDISIGKKGVRLSTVHGAKGLEATSVFLLDFDLDADKAKMKLGFTDISDAKGKEMFFIKPKKNELFEELEKVLEQQYSEEKKELVRLLYVAMTRARDNLYVLGENSGKSAYGLIFKNTAKFYI
ncbi:MAG: UvrD-helicase domain-containing protein [Holosporales bacterium]|nr:UvrD-helicase domain-containing protein [Holosporales bacterium]